MKNTRAKINFNKVRLSAAKVRFAQSNCYLMSKHSGGKNEGKPVIGLHNKREPNTAFWAFASLAIEMSNNLLFKALRK